MDSSSAMTSGRSSAGWGPWKTSGSNRGTYPCSTSPSLKSPWTWSLLSNVQGQDLRSKITGKPVPEPSSDAIFASCDVRFKTANQLAINKLNAEKWKKKMKDKYRRNKIAEALMEY